MNLTPWDPSQGLNVAPCLKAAQQTCAEWDYMPGWHVTVPNSLRWVGSTVLSASWKKFPVGHYLEEVLCLVVVVNLRQLCGRMEGEQRFNLNSLKKYSFSVWIPPPAGGWTNTCNITVVSHRRHVTCQGSDISYEMCVRQCYSGTSWSAVHFPEGIFQLQMHCN